MTHDALLIAHVAGALMLGTAIVGVLFADDRVRRARTLEQIDDALRRIERFERRMLAPGIGLLFASGVWLVALGVVRPQSWATFWIGAVAALVAAAFAAYAVTSGARAANSRSRASVDGDGRSPSVAASTSRHRT